MPVAKTLRDYLLNPSSTLPRRKSVSKAVRDILRILEQPEREGGATYSLYFGDQFREPFFAVALDNRLTQRLRLREPQDIFQAARDFVEQNYRLLRHPRCCIGVWKGVNPDGTERLFLDVTVLVYNEDVAYTFSVEGNQIAMFDLQAGMEKDTGGTGLAVPDSPAPQERLQLLETQDRLEIVEGADHDDGSTQ